MSPVDNSNLTIDTLPDMGLKWDLFPHEPSPEQAQEIQTLRVMALAFGSLIEERCPKSREASLARTNLEQSLMWAVAAIARDQPDRPKVSR